MLPPDGAGEPQFVSSAVVEPGCDTADPDGELEAEPLLEIGLPPLLDLSMFD